MSCSLRCNGTDNRAAPRRESLTPISEMNKKRSDMSCGALVSVVFCPCSLLTDQCEERLKQIIDPTLTVRGKRNEERVRVAQMVRALPSGMCHAERYSFEPSLLNTLY